MHFVLITQFTPQITTKNTKTSNNVQNNATFQRMIFILNIQASRAKSQFNFKEL